MTKSRVAFILTFLVCLAGAASASIFGQQAPASSPNAPASDELLLAEIRGLRADLNRVLSANVRAQLFVGRLQLQEQRMNTLSAQLAEVRASSARVALERTKQAERLDGLEDELAKGGIPPDQRNDIQGMTVSLKGELSRAAASLERLQIQEAELTGQLASEQGRWVYFNDALDQIEQSLVQVPAPLPD
jgi:hypothetical protein